MSEMSCPICGRSFGTERGLKTHKGRMHNELTESRLTELYVRQNLSAQEIADRVDRPHGTVKNWLSKHDLWGKDPVSFRLQPDSGYPVISSTGVGGDARRIRVHRLLAIAEGYDPHKVFSGEYDIHHRNGVKFDNRPENLELMRHDEHASHHQ